MDLCTRENFLNALGKINAKGKRIGGMLRNVSRGGLNSSKYALEGWEKVGIPSLMYASDGDPTMAGYHGQGSGQRTE